MRIAIWTDCCSSKIDNYDQLDQGDLSKREGKVACSVATWQFTCIDSDSRKRGCCWFGENKKRSDSDSTSVAIRISSHYASQVLKVGKAVCNLTRLHEEIRSPYSFLSFGRLNRGNLSGYLIFLIADLIINLFSRSI